MIIRLLRKRAGFSIHKTANLIRKSAGWLCEIENGQRNSQLSAVDFDRVVEILGGAGERHQFKTWIAGLKNQDRSNKVFDGAVLKFIRIKKGLSLSSGARKIGISKGYLSKLETGAAPISLERRNQIMIAYGYNPSSFKNLSTDPVRSKAVPSRFKFQIMMQQLSAEQAESFFESFLETLQAHKPKT
jgi:transcriptional regulator with XRE-family HTH domain